MRSELSRQTLCVQTWKEKNTVQRLYKNSKGRSISEEDAGNSIVSRSAVEETHLNENHHMLERSESSPEAQRKEGGMGLEGVDSSPIAPFTFLHEEIEASVFSSLIKQAAGHPQDSLMEETGVAHPTSFNIDGGSQCINFLFFFRII